MELCVILVRGYALSMCYEGRSIFFVRPTVKGLSNDPSLQIQLLNLFYHYSTLIDAPSKLCLTEDKGNRKYYFLMVIQLSKGYLWAICTKC